MKEPESLPFDYNKIDTSQIEKISDEYLLECIKRLPIIGSSCAGWANVAELSKRFQRLIEKDGCDERA